MAASASAANDPPSHASSLRQSLNLFSSSGRSSTEVPKQITLLDNTQPQTGLDSPPSLSHADSPHSGSLNPFSSKNKQEGISRGPGTLRKAIAQRKYRRWKEPGASEDDVMVMEIPSTAGSSEEAVNGVYEQGQGTNGVNGVNGANGRRREKKKEPEVSEIDVLYENQRGAFMCGIPLFSSKSLLNFDPSPWQNFHNDELHDSAVSIVNAQVPDPSWVWAWKSWYVDMASDVDEEGWAYSFSFHDVFSWHGTHVWFHSFVRRRRWLRKRIKLPPGQTAEARGDSLDKSRQGHGFTQDYFTIHSTRKKDKKHRSVVEGGEWRGESESELSEEEEEIGDIPSLFRVLKKARLDREKVEAVVRFVEQSGEEVAYLAERMPELMSFMIFQASRRQLLTHLVSVSEALQQSLTPSPAPLPSSPVPSVPPSVSSEQALISTAASQPMPPSRSSSPSPSTDLAARSRRIDSLRKAIEAADEEVKRLEYWSDVKDVAQKGESVTLSKDEDGSEGNALGLSGPAPPGFRMMEEVREGWKGKGKGKEKAAL